LVSTRPLPLYAREKHGTTCTGALGFGTDMDSMENHASPWVRSPDHPVLGQSHGHTWKG
jgi:hypothetical protein